MSGFNAFLNKYQSVTFFPTQVFKIVFTKKNRPTTSVCKQNSAHMLWIWARFDLAGKTVEAGRVVGKEKVRVPNATVLLIERIVYSKPKMVGKLLHDEQSFIFNLAKCEMNQ